MKDYVIATILCLATVGVLASCTAPELPVSSDDPSPAVSGEPTPNAPATDDPIGSPSPDSSPESTLPNTTDETAWNVVFDADGTLTVPAIGGDSMIHLVLNKLDTGRLPSKNINRIVVGNSVIETKTSRSDNPNIDGVWLDATSAYAFGYTVVFQEDQMPLYGNFEFSAFELNDCFVLSVVDTILGRGGTYIFTRNGVCHVPPADTDGMYGYNASIYRFYADGDTLCYTRTIAKYNQYQYVGQMLQKCVSRDELYRESGTVSFDGTTLVYHPTKTETVSDIYDLDAEYEKWCNSPIGTNFGINSTDIPLDEYLKINATKYGKAE